MIITRCLSTKYSLLLFWHYFFQSSRLLAVLDQCTPAIVLKSPVYLVAGLPRRCCPMRGSHIVASCANLQLCSRAKCPPHFHFRVVARWTASAVFAKALILTFGTLSRRDKPKIFRSIFLSQTCFFFLLGLSVSRFGSRKIVLGRYRIPVLRIVIFDLDSYLVEWILGSKISYKLRQFSFSTPFLWSAWRRLAAPDRCTRVRTEDVLNLLVLLRVVD